MGKKKTNVLPSIPDRPFSREKNNRVREERGQPHERTIQVFSDEAIESEAKDEDSIVECKVVVQACGEC
ncbi:hypothetical protein M1146_03980 [Patescibacteria group bacterium]|nr:hypothetical protein [Patescibacteria group bacterium]